jgi:hypothetical protein
MNRQPRRLPRTPPPALRILDLLLVVVAAPIILLVGAPLAGYAIGGAAWLLVRALGAAVDRCESANAPVIQQAAMRMSYRLVRATLLVGATLLALRAGGREDALVTLGVLAVAFTIRLPVSLLEAPGARGSTR